MGKSYTPTYRVEYRDQTGWNTVLWKGKASAKALEAWRVQMNESLRPGGVNDQIGKALGFTPHVSHAKLIHQASRQVVAEAKMPMFEVV